MSNAQSVLRSLIIYAICVPLAIVLGYKLTNPLDVTTYLVVGIVLFIIIVPLLLNFHHILLILSWNTCVVIFFLPGHPHLWLLAVVISLVVAIGHRTLNPNMHFIHVPQLTWPLLALVVVVVVTAKLTGGVGLKVMGDETYGGRRYFYLLGAIFGYFALTTRRISHEHAGLLVALFFLGGLTNMIGDFYAFTPQPLTYFYLLFPPNASLTVADAAGFSGVRLMGLTAAAFAVYCFMLSKYGIRGILTAGKPWRLIAFFLITGVSFSGGYRSTVLAIGLIFWVQFYLEGLHRTKLLPMILFAMVAVGTCSLPFLTKLPFVVQRAIAFLPVQIDEQVRANAETSSDWRVAIWKAVLPQIPQHLLLGKGYGLARENYEFAQSTSFRAISEDQGITAEAGDYHNGPLSVVLTFGIWGVVAFLWFSVAGGRVLYNNYRYGDPALRNVNALLLAAYVQQMVMFLFVVGGLSSDMLKFTGWLGLSVSLNGGLARRPAPVPVPTAQKARVFPGVPPRPRPVFER